MKKKEGKIYFSIFKYIHFSQFKLRSFIFFHVGSETFRVWELLVRVLGFVSSLLFSFTFRIVYKDFMRHFVLNLKSQEGNSLTRPKLQPSRMPVSSLPLR